MSTKAILALLTDFGNADPYVAAMKGVILARAPQVRLIELSHEIPPQNVLRAALFLEDSAFCFPAGTVHVAVIDPGVGTARRILAARIREQIFLAPDNGLLATLLRHDSEAEVVSVERPDLYLPVVSSTFHGRDIFAPVGAALATGKVDFVTLGPLVTDWVTLPEIDPVIEAGRITGRVLYADHFGNLVTPIRRRHLEAVEIDPTAMRVRIAGQSITCFCSTFDEVKAGQPCAYIGSAGRLEIAVNQGNAVEKLGLVDVSAGQIEIIAL